ncbi:MAG TPA: DUF1508 domain-containing protein [Candidatus Thermoplasmatota archaeon]|nr:DUF1508 domain-containing protein [Candidatus Thermoplasmatota archaeon]
MSSQFQLYKDGAGEWRWRLLAENHESIAVSSEGYVAKADALNGIDILRHMRGQTEVYQDKAGEWRWRLVHANGNVIATGGEGYVARSDCEYGLSLAGKLAKDAPVRETAS